MEGDHLGTVSPFVIGKWIVGEGVSSLIYALIPQSLHLYFPHMVRAAFQIHAHVCMWVCLISVCIAN